MNKNNLTITESKPGEPIKTTYEFEDGTKFKIEHPLVAPLRRKAILLFIAGSLLIGLGFCVLYLGYLYFLPSF